MVAVDIVAVDIVRVVLLFSEWEITPGSHSPAPFAIFLMKLISATGILERDSFAMSERFQRAYSISLIPSDNIE